MRSPRSSGQRVATRQDPTSHSGPAAQREGGPGSKVPARRYPARRCTRLKVPGAHPTSGGRPPTGAVATGLPSTEQPRAHFAAVAPLVVKAPDAIRDNRRWVFAPRGWQGVGNLETRVARDRTGAGAVPRGWGHAGTGCPAPGRPVCHRPVPGPGRLGSGGMAPFSSPETPTACLSPSGDPHRPRRRPRVPGAVRQQVAAAAGSRRSTAQVLDADPMPAARTWSPNTSTGYG
jgi:hypothetical protein